MSTRLFLQNLTSQDLSAPAQALQAEFRTQRVNIANYIFTLAPVLSALQKEDESTCILRFESREKESMRVVLLHDSSITELALHTIQNAVSAIQSQLPMESTSLEQKSIVTAFQIGLYVMSGSVTESGDTTYTLLVIIPEGPRISSILLSPEQALELDQLNPEKWGKLVDSQNLNVLTDGALYRSLIDLGYTK